MTSKKIITICAVFFLGIIGTSLLYNIYTSFFPISIEIIGDDAEHLHVAYLLSQNERPFVDFIDNHPTLFNHYLWWLHEITGVSSIRDWDLFARITIFLHFLLCLLVFYLWTSKLIITRPGGWKWIGMLIASWAMLGLYNSYFHWIWQIRPDFICYAYTLWGCYFIFLYSCRRHDQEGYTASFPLILGGILIGFGNAILPKGIIIILALLLAFFTRELFMHHGLLSYFRNKKIPKILCVASISAGLSFLSTMLLDCHLSQITPIIWIKAVFLLNSRKHPIFTLAETNPITSITTAFSLNFYITLALAVWVIWELSLLQFRNKDNNGEIFLWLFSIFIILINLLLGTYTNGVTWSYYFIPSIFAAALIYLLLLLRILGLWNSKLLRNQNRLRKIVFFGLFIFIIIQILPQCVEPFFRYPLRQIALREANILTSHDYLLEEIYPTSFVYLAQFPCQMPIKARHWGYYFMLVLDQKLWSDCHSLGLGPDPENTWKANFSKHPPDAIALTRPFEIIGFVLALSTCQGINANWLFKEVKDNYVLMNTKGGCLYVRRDKISYLYELGWRIAISNNEESLLP